MADIEKISTQQLDTPFKSDEYKELLLQAVAVIESARFRLARQVAATSNDTYWEMQKCNAIVPHCIMHKKLLKKAIAAEIATFKEEHKQDLE